MCARCERPIHRYAISSAFVIGAGAVLPRIAVEIARQMGWSNTFVGTIFVAFATSVPEVAISITAMAIGSVDMAVANLLGSNLFDVAILALDDLVYTGGPIFSAVSPSHAVTAVSAAVMSGVAIVGFSYRPASRVFRISSWVGLSLPSIYSMPSCSTSMGSELREMTMPGPGTGADRHAKRITI
jgi:cation:H+ antiporter